MELASPGESTIVVKAGCVVDFDVIGAGGAGGNWAGADGRSGTRLSGVIAASGHDRVFVLHCGGGGQIDATVNEDVGHAGPALGGLGGTGHESGGQGGWGAGGVAGGGGGGGGASSLTATDGSVIVIAGGGGGGGGGGDPTGSRAFDGKESTQARTLLDAASSHHDGQSVTGLRADQPGSIDGANGRSRHRVAGGGGGGGGGGAPSGSGGIPGEGGGSGVSMSAGVAGVVEGPADNHATDDDLDPTIGCGGGGGARDRQSTGDATDGRVAACGADGRVKVTWAPPGRLAARLLTTRAEEHPRRSLHVVERTLDAQRHRELTLVPPTVELHGAATGIWERTTGDVSIRQLASESVGDLRPDEQLDVTARTVTTLRALGFVKRSTPDPSAPTTIEAPFGYGYDLVGDRYPMRADPTGRPSSADLLCAVYPEDSPARRALEHIVNGLRAALGENRMIWALKHIDGRVRFEFYLFRGAAEDRPDGISGLFSDTVAAFRDLAAWNAPDRFDGDPILVSFEFSIDDHGTVEPTATIDASYNVSGRSSFVVNYELSSSESRLKSVSQGFDVVDERDLLRDHLESNRHRATGSDGAIARHWLRRIDDMTECRRCWVSFKSGSDGVYPSRTHVDDLVGLLTEFAYPEHLREWVTERRDQLDHLRFDLCYDYAVVESSVVTNRTAFCGWF